MSNQLVRTFGLSKRYGDSLSVSNLDMTVSEGKIYGFLGSKRSGKKAPHLRCCWVLSALPAEKLMYSANGLTQKIE